MHEVHPPLDLSRIAQDLQIRKVQAESVVQLLDEGNTVPFITRYRKERTGGLKEDVIRLIQDRVAQLRHLSDRKQTILRSLESQGKLTDELRHAIQAAETPKRVEDLYLPYKPKKRTLATAAREKGLEPLALAIWGRDPAVANLPEVLPTLLNPDKQLNAPEEVLLGAQHILAELIAETAEVRAGVRSYLWETAKLATTRSDNLAPDQGLDYKDYFLFSEAIRIIPAHRILAINRGEKENILRVKLDADMETIRRLATERLPLADHPHLDFLRICVDDALSRLLLPSLEREIRRELTEEAEMHAVRVFARNLRSLLLQPPLRGKRVLGVDPGFRSGCKLAALDEMGNLLEETVIFPHHPQSKRAEAQHKLQELVRKHGLQVIAIGNGTACRETEELVSEVIAFLESKGAASTAPSTPTPAVSAPPSVPVTFCATIASGLPVTATLTSTEAGAAALPPSESAAPETPAPAPAEPQVDLSSLPEAPADLCYVIVNEAGASVYSASAVGREEFPNFDATLRGTISIGRRLQDPLSELVKIDPQNIGVGLYQHDINPKTLKESLEHVIESCVNHVGVDVNTASVPLLRHVSGLNQLVARELVEYRKEHGPFRSREQLLQVPSVGPVRYTQAAGFLKVLGGDNPLDQTWIHPESYAAAQRLLAELGLQSDYLNDKARAQELHEKLRGLSPEEVAARLEVGVPTLKDILEALSRPGRDPREDLPAPIFKKGVLRLEDLHPGMELKGTVLNVVDFGAFVDIGLKDSGLVHISQLANRYVKNPYDIVAVGDIVTVWVLNVDNERRRVSLSMIAPGTERKPPERRPAEQPKEQRGSRPPRGRRPARPPVGAGTNNGQGPPAAGPEAAQPQGGGAPAQRERRPQPQRRGRQPHHQSQHQQQPQGQQHQQHQQHQPQHQRRPQRQPPKPKLSQAALEGEAPLRTFGELKAFFEAQKSEQAAPKPAVVEKPAEENPGSAPQSP